MEQELELKEIRDSISVLRRAASFTPSERTPPKVLNALTGLLAAAQELISREQRKKGTCIVRSLRVKRAHKHNGRVGGVLPPLLRDTPHNNEKQEILVGKLANSWRCDEWKSGDREQD